MNKRKILSYILIPIISVYLLICNLSIISFADVPSTQKVQSVEASWYSYGLNITGLGKYYLIEDATGLTQCTYNLPKFYYTSDNVTFNDISGVNLVVNQLNKIVGVILSPIEIQTFQTNFFNKIGLLDSENHAQGGLYDSQGNFYGYALNDITGCYYNHLSTYDNVTVPSYLPNNIYNVFKFYNGDTPPYIKIYGVTFNNVVNNYGSTLNTTQLNYLRNLFDTKENLYSLSWDTSSHKYSLNNSSFYKVGYLSTNDFYCVATSATGYSQTTYTAWCNQYGLNENHNELSFGELSANNGLTYVMYDKETLNRIQTMTIADFTNDTVTTEETTIYTAPAYGHTTLLNTIGNRGGSNSGGKIQIPLTKEPFLIYKDYNTLSALVNKTYVPNVLTTNNYKNYNVYNDNSNVVNSESVDNSVTYNSDIYNNSTENYSEYIDNSYIDNSSVTNNVTNITNNYYGTSSEGGEGGEGGGSNNDGVLDTLLQGLLAFFNAIGRVLATVITGILDMFTTVLEAIASITTDLTGVTDFFGSLFGWLPDPVPQVLGVGISVCILCAVIRFIRG